jgi:hypothetical protein
MKDQEAPFATPAVTKGLQSKSHQSQGQGRDFLNAVLGSKRYKYAVTTILLSYPPVDYYSTE